MLQINDIIRDKVSAVRGLPGDIVVFGQGGTIVDSGIQLTDTVVGQAKQPTATPRNLAVFGQNENRGQIIDSGLSVNDLSGPDKSILWTSSKIASYSVSVPDATSETLGKLRLAGDLTGSASTPRIAEHSITTTKLASLNGPSQLLGSTKSSTTVNSIRLGDGLQMNDETLLVDIASLPFLPLSGGAISGDLAVRSPSDPSSAANKAYVDSTITPSATTVTQGKIKLAGDLTGTADNPTIALRAITTSKIADISSSSLLGSDAASTAVSVISLDSTLKVNDSTLSLNIPRLSEILLPVTGGTLMGNLEIAPGYTISLNDQPSSETSAVNKGYVDSQVTPDATQTQKGKIKLGGALSGSADLPQLASASVALSNLKFLSSPRLLLGSSSSTQITEISIGSTLNLQNNTLNTNNTTLAQTFLPLTGGTLIGDVLTNKSIILQNSPVQSLEAVNKAYVDSQSTPEATSTISGRIRLAGDLTGSATSPVIAASTVTLSKLAGLTATGVLLGSSSNSTSPAQIQLGQSLTMTGSVLDVKPIFNNPILNGSISGSAVLSVANGGTGSSSLTGYLVGAGASPFISRSSIPVTDVAGAVRSVNGVLADPSGNVSVALTSVSTGSLAALPAPGPSLMSGEIYVVSGDSQTNNGRTFIYSASPTGRWLEITSNLSATDTRYLQLAGGSMTGNIMIPSGNLISIADMPNSSTSAANKAYVDSLNVLATSSVPGKILLGGDLTGSANNPSIAIGAIGLNKLSNLPATSQLIGSSGNSPNVTNLTIGPNLLISGTTLDVNTNNLSNSFLSLGGGSMNGDLTTKNVLIPSGNSLSITDGPSTASSAVNKAYVDTQATPSATTTTQGKIQLSGDLSGNATAPVVAPNAITTSKLANLSDSSQLLGSASSSSVATNISLGNGLIMSESILNVNINSLPFLSLAGGVMSGNITLPSSQPTSILNAVSKGYVDAQIPKQATSTTLGLIALGGDLTGTAATPVIGANTITTAKLANLSGFKMLLGSGESSNSATNISIGQNLQITGITLDINKQSLSSLFLPLSGGSLTGSLSIPTGNTLTLADAPTTATSAVNKAYVDAQATPSATPTTQGKVQLAGDLTGTAAAPAIAANAVTVSKLAVLGGSSQLLGSASSSSAATNISLGSGLQMSGSTLNINTSSLPFLPISGGSLTGSLTIPTGNTLTVTDAPTTATSVTNKAYVDAQVTPSATTTAQGKIQLAGDLTGTATAPVIAANAVTVSKLAVLSGSSQLLGSASSSSSATNISLGSGLQMTGSVLSVNTSSLPFLPLSGGTLTGSLTIPTSNTLTLTDAPTTATSAVNKAYVDAQTTPSATTTTQGKIQLAGDLTGTATAPAITSNAVTISKLAALTGSSQLLGSASSSSAATNISLGNGLQMTGSVLGINTAVVIPVVSTATSGNIATFNSSGQIVDSGTNINNNSLTSSSLWNAAKLSITTNSWLPGINPNISAPTDRPLTSNVLYVGTDGSTWIYNGSDYLSLNQPKKVNTGVTRPLQTSTGAVGFQVSTSAPASVKYSVAISTTIGVGTVNLETCPTNSANAADWIVNAQTTNSQSFSGLLTLTSVNTQTTQITTYVPAGYYIKLRTITSGTATYSYITGVEVIG